MRLYIQVQPGAKSTELVTELALPAEKFMSGSGEVTARKYKIKSAPEDGAANEELVAVIARDYKVTKSQVKIIKGKSSRYKIVEIT